MPRPLARLAGIATVAGAYSALFGVGAGTVIAPLLILGLAYEEREATATSLAAIVVIAAFGAGVHGLYGNVDVANGIVIALPAVAGVVAGTALQQRIPQRALSALLVLLLIGSAAVLVVQ